MNSETEQALINFVHQNPCLYDKNNTQYKQKVCTDAIWNMFSMTSKEEKLQGAEGAIAQRHWNGLRCLFTQVYREHQDYPGPRSQEAINTFPHYKQMQWLIPFIRRRRKKANRPPNACQRQAEEIPEVDKELAGPSSESNTATISDGALESSDSESTSKSTLMSPLPLFGCGCPTVQPRKPCEFSFLDDDRQSTSAQGLTFMTGRRCSPSSDVNFISKSEFQPVLNVASQPFKPMIGSVPGLTTGFIPADNPPPIIVDHGDVNFMNSVIFDMQKLEPKPRMIFKSKVFLLLAEQM